MKSTPQKAVSVPSYLTIAESPEEFELLREQMYQAIKPQDCIENIYVDDAIDLTWHIRRLRRWRFGMLNAVLLPALQGLLEQVLCGQDSEFPYEKDRGAEDLARGWFTNKKTKAQILRMLRQFGLDESSIESEAFMLRAEELEGIDRMLTTAEVRRENSLRFIAKYRKDLAKRIARCSDEILEIDGIPLVTRIERSA